jgi:membrane protease YdiL (CAAX protease family)
MGYFSTMAVPQILAWFVTIRLGLQWADVPFGAACPVRRFPLRIVPALLGASYGATIVLLEIAGWIPMPPAMREGLQRSSLQGDMIGLLVPVVIVAPLAEEMFFRGLLLRGYLERYSRATAIWGSAVLFALFHLNPWQGIIALPLGVAYAWLVVRTGSLLPSMLSHAMVNFSNNFLLVPLAAVLGYSAAELEAADHFPPLMLGFGAVLMVGGSFVVWQQLGRGPATMPAIFALEPTPTPPNEAPHSPIDSVVIDTRAAEDRTF